TPGCDVTKGGGLNVLLSDLRRRCKSLPTPTERAKLEISRSRSPTSQKRVRFADSLGLELISVKHFDDTDEPEVPERILAKLAKGHPDLHHLDTKFPRAPAQSMLMELQFTNPGTLPGFEQKVREVKVLLETVQVDEFSMSGFVRVLNLAFEKSVSLRYSLNNWLTCMDSLASYVPDSSKGDTDKFRFKIVMPTYLDNGGTFQFAIKYCVGGTEFWDNNNGNNYKMFFSQTASCTQSRDTEKYLYYTHYNSNICPDAVTYVRSKIGGTRR
uniref:CBM21 domain-containing protein n=1 Tax=Gasterosteus aculeatus aculeatus TaxID=481459 RepID=A0AAQ4S6Z9_GASAC